MKIDDVEVHAGKPTFEFEPIQKIEAKAPTFPPRNALPSIETMNDSLRAAAAKLDADAVVDVVYDRDAFSTLTKATGLAVRKVSDEVKCPFCSEFVKRSAIKCKHCGSDISGQAKTPSNPDTKPIEPQMPKSAKKLSPAEQKTSNWFVVGFFGLALLVFLGFIWSTPF